MTEKQPRRGLSPEEVKARIQAILENQGRQKTLRPTEEQIEEALTGRSRDRNRPPSR